MINLSLLPYPPLLHTHRMLATSTQPQHAGFFPLAIMCIYFVAFLYFSLIYKCLNSSLPFVIPSLMEQLLISVSDPGSSFIVQNLGVKKKQKMVLNNQGAGQE